jgi:dUTP pyrophosphatase
MKAKIRRSNPNIPLPAYITREAAAFDFAANEDATVRPGEIARIRTGLFIEAPEGYFLAILPRSSTPKRGLSFPHSIGVVDRDYSGPDDEILIQVINFTGAPVEIKKGERIAQGMFLPIQKVEWEEAPSLRDTTRGGFGASGN